jgi:hypothetical protein
MRQQTEGADVHTLNHVVAGIGMLVQLGVLVWLIATWPRMRREMEASRAANRRHVARMAAIAAEALGRERP